MSKVGAITVKVDAYQWNEGRESLSQKREREITSICRDREREREREREKEREREERMIGGEQDESKFK